MIMISSVKSKRTTNSARTPTRVPKQDGVRDPSPSVTTWRNSLRPSEFGDTRKSLTLSGELIATGKSLKTSNSFNDTVRSSTGPLEHEYIKSLQQQIYLLELENNHLRSQAVKATELHPAMAAEAERMLNELKSLQLKIETLEMENYRKEGAAEILQQRLNSLTGKLSQNQDLHGHEKEVYQNELTEIRRERDMYQRDATRLELRFKSFEEDFNRKLNDLKNAEAKVSSQRAQLESALDKVAALETVLTEERTLVARLEAKIQVLQIEAGQNNCRSLEKIVNELKEENSQLKEKLRSALTQSEREILLKTKISDEISVLVKENARLQHTVTDLERQLDHERDHYSEWKLKMETENEQVLKLKEREKTLEYQVSRGIEEVANLRLLLEQHTHKLSEVEKLKDSERFELSTARQRIADLEVSVRELREKADREKRQLVEHVDHVQTELRRRESEKESLEAALKSAESRLTEMQAEFSRSGYLQATRWSEIEKLADSLRSTAHTNAVLFDKN